MPSVCRGHLFPPAINGHADCQIHHCSVNLCRIYSRVALQIEIRGHHKKNRVDAAEQPALERKRSCQLGWMAECLRSFKTRGPGPLPPKKSLTVRSPIPIVIRESAVHVLENPVAVGDRSRSAKWRATRGAEPIADRIHDGFKTRSDGLAPATIRRIECGGQPASRRTCQRRYRDLTS